MIGESFFMLLELTFSEESSATTRERTSEDTIVIVLENMILETCLCCESLGTTRDIAFERQILVMKMQMSIKSISSFERLSAIFKMTSKGPVIEMDDIVSSGFGLEFEDFPTVREGTMVTIVFIFVESFIVIRTLSIYGVA